MKILLTLKVFIILALTQETENRVISDKCSTKATCETCVNSEDCHWVTLWEGTSVCSGNPPQLGIRYTAIVTSGAGVHCKTSVAENTNHSTHEVRDYNYITRNTPTNYFAKNQEQSILMKTQTNIVGSTKSYLYKQKTVISLKFLNSIIPRIQVLQQNLTTLVNKNAENKSGSNENWNYKIADQKLDSELVAIEQHFYQNRMLLKEYTVAYQNLEEQMKFLNDTLQRALGSTGN